MVKQPIPGFPDYFATDDGRIWSGPKKLGGHNGKFLTLTMDKKGYVRVHMSKYKRGCTCKVHRLVLETFIGPCPKGMEACHNNGDVSNNTIENLRWDTRSNNTKDAIKHGKHNCLWLGEKHGSAKLNNLQVRIIKRLLGFGSLSQRCIAKIFNISQPTIASISVGRVWKHIHQKGVCSHAT